VNAALLAVYLSCIAEVETGHLPPSRRDRTVGSAGEVSRYQMTWEVWKAFCPPMMLAAHANVHQATLVAGNVLEARCKDHLNRTGMPPTAFEVYRLWHRPGRGKLTKAERERCQRFANLVQSKLQSTDTRGQKIPSNVARR